MATTAAASDLAKLAQQAKAPSPAAVNGNGKADDAFEKKTPRVPKEPLVVSGPSQDELLTALSTGKLTIDQYKAAVAGAKSNVQMGVGEAGWGTLYFPGCRFPVNAPVEVFEFTTSPEGSTAIRAFIAKHNASFSRK